MNGTASANSLSVMRLRTPFDSRSTKPHEQGGTGGKARLPGLDPGRTYRITPLAVAGEPQTKQAVAPRWTEAGGVTLGGRALAEVGLPLPVLRPEQALLLHLTSP